MVTEHSLVDIFARQKTNFAASGFPSVDLRRDRLARLKQAIRTHADVLVAAIEDDFGQRSEVLSRLAEIETVIGPIDFASENLPEWMASEPRTLNSPLEDFGATGMVMYQPLGVVGIMAPWNAPARLCFHPLTDVLAAGNRAMVKPSDLTPATSAVVARIVEEAFSPQEVAVIQGGPHVSAEFARLPFDHLIFTGGGEIGKRVMASAAENLVPVTLELGGKCPTVIGEGADHALAVERLATGKFINAGQVCISPDYLFVKREQFDETVEALVASIARQYPTLVANPDYTAIINRRHFERIRDLVNDARARGAVVHEVNPANETFGEERPWKIPPTLILDPPRDARITTEEIFGPLLTIKPYDDIDEVIGCINSGPRPLALYYFGAPGDERERVVRETTSGNVVVNDVMTHTFQDSIPFGGVGASGMGAYRGRDGFRTFSHAKGVVIQADTDIAGLAGHRPPYDHRIKDALGMSGSNT
ncbi:coniferyl aldehyde dehydrogenase [Burkholderia stagnalis]